MRPLVRRLARMVACLAIARWPRRESSCRCPPRGSESPLPSPGPAVGPCIAAGRRAGLAASRWPSLVVVTNAICVAAQRGRHAEDVEAGSAWAAPGRSAFARITMAIGLEDTVLMERLGQEMGPGVTRCPAPSAFLPLPQVPVRPQVSPCREARRQGTAPRPATERTTMPRLVLTTAPEDATLRP